MSKNTYFTNFVTNLSLFKSHSSHAIVSGTTASLWTNPVDVLADILDVAGLTVDAVSGVNDKLHHACVIWLILVHAGGAEPTLGTIELGIVEIFRNIVIHQGEVSGLISFVIGYGKL